MRLFVYLSVSFEYIKEENEPTLCSAMFFMKQARVRARRTNYVLNAKKRPALIFYNISEN